MRNALAHRYGIDQLDLGALDGQDADRFVLTIGHQRQIAGRIDAQARGLFPNRDCGNGLWRVCLEIDDMYLVVGDLLQAIAILDDIDRVGNQRDRTGRIDIEVDRRTDHRVFQRQIGDDLRVQRVGKVDDQNGIPAGGR